MLTLILQSIYILLPAYFANMTPVLIRNLTNFLNYPIDFNKKLNNKPILGKNKTFRGLFFGVIIAIITAFIQHLLTNYTFFRSISILDYSNFIMIGFLLGLGALAGDLVESFIKRRLSLKPGQRFIPWDQTDFVIGALLLISLIQIPPIDLIIIALLISIILHIATNHLAFYLKIRKEKW